MHTIAHNAILKDSYNIMCQIVTILTHRHLSFLYQWMQQSGENLQKMLLASLDPLQKIVHIVNTEDI